MCYSSVDQSHFTTTGHWRAGAAMKHVSQVLKLLSHRVSPIHPGVCNILQPDLPFQRPGLQAKPEARTERCGLRRHLRSHGRASPKKRWAKNRPLVCWISPINIWPSNKSRQWIWKFLEDDSVNPELDFSGLDRNGSFGTLGHWRNPQAPRRKVQFVG